MSRNAAVHAGLRDRLQRGAETLGLALEAPADGQLLELVGLLSGWGGRMNLTAHRTPEAILDRLVLDALALSTVIPPFHSLADVGSGAGFPGLPLAILHPEARVTLIEARERKHHFQRQAVRALGLGHVRPLLGRAETLPAEPHHGVLAQAAGEAGRLAPVLLRWVDRGGWLGIPGGPEPPAPAPPPGVTACPPRRYRVPGLELQRTLWLGTRHADPEQGPGTGPCGSLEERG